ncbi:I78 family peptidase inhibitor [Sphingomonas bacterium]|uniref:I78 family peptidase inhibitor n=1 Tax=Sphingomonas bacterium TaxID=1895847 RepID=UPI002627DBD6|nr:I78 family peptidase inhibitor [Sphingomonas bacterium]MDB5679593.1 hypothetical protein [Sphingomonas bacterium]MDB5711042.1 hypothetical protein [Sphingomonas bacterium]
MKRAILLTPILLGACNPPLADMPMPPGKCVDRIVTEKVGRIYSAALGKRLMHVTGARTLRVIRPGQMVTMDFLEDRLNVHIDADGRILSFNCG